MVVEVAAFGHFVEKGVKFGRALPQFRETTLHPRRTCGDSRGSQNQGDYDATPEHSSIIAGTVGRTPASAPDPLVRLSGACSNALGKPTRASAAVPGARPTRPLTERGGVRIVRMIRTPHHWPCLDVREADSRASPPVVVELRGRNVAHNGQMLRRWPQILPECEDVDTMIVQIAHGLKDFLLRLTQPEHQTRLHRGFRAQLLRVPQHLERALIARPQPQ